MDFFYALYRRLREISTNSIMDYSKLIPTAFRLRERRSYYSVIVVLIIIVSIITNYWILPTYHSISTLSILKNNHRPTSGKSSSGSCQWIFDHYSPSAWELYWYNNISYFQNHVCEILAQSDQYNKSLVTLEYIIDTQKTIANRSFSSEKYDQLLSKMFYRYSCGGSSRLMISQYIEPLIGLLRDPLTMCSYPDLPLTLKLDLDNAMQSKRFFLLGPSAAYQNFPLPITSIAPWLYRQDSQKILFDLGASYFNSMFDATSITPAIGTRWFYEYFRSKSLSFDHIIAFEASQYLPDKYWKQIPDDLVGKLTFMNIGVATAGKFNPWNILKSIAKPDDYVIIKLDIDTPAIENVLIQQIVNDTSISSLIDEMFFEMHVMVNEMRGYWKSPSGELKDTYRLFRKLRDMGIRMHSWP